MILPWPVTQISPCLQLGVVALLGPGTGLGGTTVDPNLYRQGGAFTRLAVCIFFGVIGYFWESRADPVSEIGGKIEVLVIPGPFAICTPPLVVWSPRASACNFVGPHRLTLGFVPQGNACSVVALVSAGLMLRGLPVPPDPFRIWKSGPTRWLCFSLFTGGLASAAIFARCFLPFRCACWPAQSITPVLQILHCPPGAAVSTLRACFFPLRCASLVAAVTFRVRLHG